MSGRVRASRAGHDPSVCQAALPGGGWLWRFGVVGAGGGGGAVGVQGDLPAPLSAAAVSAAPLFVALLSAAVPPDEPAAGGASATAPAKAPAEEPPAAEALAEDRGLPAGLPARPAEPARPGPPGPVADAAPGTQELATEPGAAGTSRGTPGMSQPGSVIVRLPPPGRTDRYSPSLTCSIISAGTDISALRYGVKGLRRQCFCRVTFRVQTGLGGVGSH